MRLTKRNYESGDYEKYIRPLTKINLEQLFINNFGGWSDLVSETKFFKIIDNGFVELFFLEGEFIGYAAFNTEKENNQSTLLNDIHITKEYQRKGYGTEILDSVINKSIELDHKQIKVFVFKNNPSLKFYKKNGFEEIEHLEKSDTSVMIKKIKP